jgi:putative acetyltransferase
VLSDFSNLNIRSANNNDQGRIIALVFNVLREHGLSPDPETTDFDLDDIQTNYFQRGGLFEVIEDHDANLLGSVGIYPIDEATCELRKMYFIKQARGHGLGKYILHRTINHAKALGFKRMVLETSSKLEAANHLYLSFGFELMSSEHLAARADQAYELHL